MLILSAPLAGAVASQLSPVFDIEPGDLKNLLVEAQFARAGGGTSVDAYLQTTLDGGATWIDIRNFHFTTTSLNQIVNHSSATPVTTAVTPTDGSMTANTSIDGILGSQIRIKYTVVGTYTGASLLAIYAAGCRLRAP